ncbi:CMRF35-like molecule 7 isoform X1 [Gopherus evgoodei]|uniref:CMRF35-like molecule 7 isoform X1 n=1 Tax=Gopherus evgoodei TaxID=1825980 RepID=UPI0011CEE4AD|nr:CMRF35-like molecule 7 isoform X1 [Gopherus evgoodei]
MRIFSVLLWILFPGCWAVTGPGAVHGPAGGSVAVRCRYWAGYEDYPKFWCREGGLIGLFCSGGLHIVETDGSEVEVTRGRVSVRDERTQRTFTVTVENLTLADAGTYHCGVERTGPDLRDTVELTVSPAVPTSPPMTPEKDLTVATSSWTLPEVDVLVGIPNLDLYILIPSILLVLLLILFIAVKFKRASQRRRKALEDTPGQKDKNAYLYNPNPGHKPPFSVSDPTATGQLAIYMNEQHLPSSADPASEYESMIPQRSQVSGQRKAVFSGPQDCSATDQQDTYVTMYSVTPRPPMICHHAKCGRKAAG